MKCSPAILFAFSALVPVAARSQIPATVTEQRITTQRGVRAGDSLVLKTDTTYLRTTITSLGARMEYSGGSASPMPQSPFGATQIATLGDSGMSITFLDPAKKTYYSPQLFQMMKNLRAMTAATGVTNRIEPTSVAGQIDSIGPGPIIAGYKTFHFRTRSSHRMIIAIRGESDTLTTVSVSDIYVAPGFKTDALPLDSTTPRSRMLADSVLKFLPEGVQEEIALSRPSFNRMAQIGRPVKSEAEIRMSGRQLGVDMSGTTRITTELLSVRKTSVPDSIFHIPADYRMVDPLAEMRAKADSMSKKLRSLRTPS